jgi:hypothetical protein
MNKLSYLIPSFCGALVLLAPVVRADNRTEADIFPGSHMPQDVSAYCAPNNGCSVSSDFISYQAALNTGNWATATGSSATLTGGALQGSDWAFCSNELACSDGSYPIDTETFLKPGFPNVTTCNTTCPAGTTISEIILLVGVNP